MNIQNNLQLIGNLGKDAERTNFKNGNGVLDFSIAQTVKYKDNLGEDKEITNWHQVKIFRKAETLDKLEQYFTKGKRVILQGELRYEEFETKKEKQKVIRAYMHTESFEFLSGKKKDEEGEDVATTEEP
ncbi:single-stranded DNA-binding protein [Ekhidna sp. MALMAid0563]|uniref:single-stranded DNA-binding protein n=1 Tax=Ekhidna sp. MALMAid0563 TaxID=3143937 RepID=UPI0032E00B0B